MEPEVRMDMTEQSKTSDTDMEYAEALEELNEILAAIEDDRFDLDELGDKVGRAASLIRLCRKKIDATELQIQSIIEDLDEEEG